MFAGLCHAPLVQRGVIGSGSQEAEPWPVVLHDGKPHQLARLRVEHLAIRFLDNPRFLFQFGFQLAARPTRVPQERPHDRVAVRRGFFGFFQIEADAAFEALRFGAPAERGKGQLISADRSAKKTGILPSNPRPGSSTRSPTVLSVSRFKTRPNEPSLASWSAM